MKQFFDGETHYEFNFKKIGIDIHGFRGVGLGIDIQFQPAPFLTISIFCFIFMFIYNEG